MEIANISDGAVQTGYNGTKKAAWIMLTLLSLLMFVDFADRQVIVSMFPFLKPQWSLSDLELSMLTSVVSYAVAIFALPVGILADRWSRVKCIFLMALIWSLATIACSLAKSHTELLLYRSIVGIGEAGYNGVGIALIANAFPTQLRGRILALFNVFAAFGSVFGVLVGGMISQNYGWQYAFGAMGVPGVILSILFLVLVKDYKTESLTSEETPVKAKLNLKEIFTQLLSRPSALMIYVATGAQFVVVAAMFTWIPSFFNRAYGMEPKKAAMMGAAVLLLTSVSAFFWGYMVDKMGRINHAIKSSLF